MLRQISYLDKLIVLIFSVLLIVDSANGFLLLSGVNLPISLSQAVKMPLIFLMLFRVFVLNNIYFIHILSLIFILWSSIFLNYYLLGAFNIPLESAIFLKLVIIPISMYYFVAISKLDYDFYIKVAKNVFIISFLVILLNITLGMAGLGFNSYTEGIGSKGFFYAGNELSILYVVLFAFLLRYVFQEYSTFRYAIFSALGLFFGLFIATKVSMLSILTIIFLLPLLKVKWKFTVKRFIAILVVGGSFTLLAIFVYNYMFVSGLMDKWTYFLKIYDYNYVSIILSGRNRYLEQSFIMSSLHPGILHQFLGYSYAGYIDLVSQTSTLRGQSIEMDFFDVYFYYGILGLFAVLSFWMVAIYVYLKNKFDNIFILSTVILVLIISFLSGHVLFSGLSGPFIGIFLSLMFQNDLFPQRTANQ